MPERSRPILNNRKEVRLFLFGSRHRNPFRVRMVKNAPRRRCRRAWRETKVPIPDLSDAFCSLSYGGTKKARPPWKGKRALHRKAKPFEERNKSFGFTRDLRLLHDLALRIHNAHAREFQ